MDKTRTDAESAALRLRLGGFNSWPSLTPVSMLEYDLANAEAAYRFAFLYGLACGKGQYHQVRMHDLPPEVRSFLGRHENCFHVNAVWFTYAQARGQVDDLATRNLLAVIPARESYSFELKAMVFSSPGLVLELGCAHDYEVTDRGNAWARSRCQRCGHTWEVDSSG